MEIVKVPAFFPDCMSVISSAKCAFSLFLFAAWDRRCKCLSLRVRVQAHACKREKIA